MKLSGIYVLIGVAILLSLSITAGIVYAIFHFILKFW